MKTNQNNNQSQSLSCAPAKGYKYLRIDPKTYLEVKKNLTPEEEQKVIDRFIERHARPMINGKLKAITINQDEED